MYALISKGYFPCTSSDINILTVTGGGGGILFSPFPLVFEGVLYLILAGGWRKRFESDIFEYNEFLVQLSQIY